MSKHVDIDQLERDMGDGGGEYVNIHHDDLTNLIQRVREGETFLARFNAWMAECPGNR